MKNHIKVLVVLALVAGVVAAQADQNNFSISGGDSSHGLSNNPLNNLDQSNNNGDHSGGGGDKGNPCPPPKIQCVPAPSSFLGLGLGIGALALLKRRNS